MLKHRLLLNSMLVMMAVSALSACQTDRLKEISEIENGMSKAKVLGIAGGPQRSERKGDEDQWMYVVPEERRDVVKEVRFRDGRVSYVGDPIAATGPSAAEQDRLNEESNAKSEAQRRRDQLLEELSPKGHSSAATTAPSISSAPAASAVTDDEPESTPPPKAKFVPIDGGSAQ